VIGDLLAPPPPLWRSLLGLLADWATANLPKRARPN
jgi:hypothetical protein